MKAGPFLLIISLILSFSSLNAQFACRDFKFRPLGDAFSDPSLNHNARSDTFDILHYDLMLDFTSLPQRFLRGRASLQITPLASHSGVLPLDLLLLQVDSIKQDGQAVGFSHNDTLLNVNLLPATGVSDTFTLVVYYQGSPPGDASGWGGWHHQNPYFFNLGVGFAANPHVYGRAWHPCFDNFVEKATYSFQILTRLPRKAYCNGIRMAETPLAGDTLLTHWQMSDPIPSYLASVAVSNYAEINDTVQAIQGVKPIQLMARSADSTSAIAAFTNLKAMLHAFEKAYGPYRWQRIGYVMTTVGAMEHATSIHLPRTLLNPGGEDIIAHELAHHWWGNLVTCETDLDMWINEGMAEYSSHLYTEEVYSQAHYRNVVRDNAFRVLEQAHKSDNGYKAIQGLDHDYVYGFHVYQKGAMVAHNLRGYLGDSSFFAGLNQLLNNHAFKTLNSGEFRDQLSLISGLDLTDFFQNWVFNPGFVSVWTDSVHFSGSGGNHSATVRLRQAPHQAPGLYSKMPVDVSFFDASGAYESRRVILNAAQADYQFQNLSIKPEFAMANYEARILTADVFDEYSFNGTFLSRYSKFSITPLNNTASNRVISTHHLAGPGGKAPVWGHFNMAKNHFWTLQYTNNNDLFSGRISFNGGSLGMDSILLRQSADSLTVLYRPHGGVEWQLWPHQTKTAFGPPGNIQGFFELDSLIPGDYALANTSESVGLENYSDQLPFSIYPNPAQNYLRIEFTDHPNPEELIQIYDQTGRVLYRQIHQIDSSDIKISLDHLSGEFLLVQVGAFIRKISLLNP